MRVILTITANRIHSMAADLEGRRWIAETRARQSTECSVFHGAGHASAGVLSGAGLGREGAAPSGRARGWALALVGL